MNNFINALLLFLLFPIMAFTIAVGFDLPIEFLKTSGAQFPYRFEVFLIAGVLIFSINVRRSIRRWMGMHLVNQLKKFTWNAPMSNERIKRVKVYTIMEAAVLFFIGTTLYELTPEAIIVACGFWFATADNLVFLLVGTQKHRFRIGITKKAVIAADREVSVLYFSGLRRVSIQQQTIYFDYIKELQLYFPLDCIPTGEQDAFFAAVEGAVDTEKVFVTKERRK
jgi:hypothetical protein